MLADRLSAFAVLGGFLWHYYFLYVSPAAYAGTLLDEYRAVAEGVAFAPVQYRVLPAHVVVWLVDGLHLPDRYAVIGFDTACLFAGFAALLRCVELSAIRISSVLVALYVVLWGLGALTYPKSETFLAFGGVNLGLWLYLEQRHRWLQVGLTAAVIGLLATSRVEMLLTLALPFAARWWRARKPFDLALVVILLTVGLAAYGALRWAFPVGYGPGVAVVQLDHNLAPGVFLLPVVMAFPVLVAVWHAWRAGQVPLWGDVLLWLGAYTVAVFIVGRATEVRLWLPFAGIMGVWVSASRTRAPG